MIGDNIKQTKSDQPDSLIKFKQNLISQKANQIETKLDQPESQSNFLMKLDQSESQSNSNKT